MAKLIFDKNKVTFIAPGALTGPYHTPNDAFWLAESIAINMPFKPIKVNNRKKVIEFSDEKDLIHKLVDSEVDGWYNIVESLIDKIKHKRKIG